MQMIRAQTMNELIYKGLDAIVNEGIRTSSRNGDTLTLYNTFFTLENPRSRHLNLKGRKNNIFAMIAETFWVMAGDDKVDPLLVFFLPRARDFSDDGTTWRGGYGPRLYMYDQLEDAIRTFEEEGLQSRRSVITIYLPELDTKESLKNRYGLENTKDRPCNNMIHFFVTPDLRLHMNVFQRSGDVIWGMGSINVFEWTLLHEFVAAEVARRRGEPVTLGTYNHFVTNLHMYDFTGEQGYAVLANADAHDLTSESHDPLIFPAGVEKTRGFCAALVSIWSEAIQSSSADFDSLMERTRVIFAEAYDSAEAQDSLIFDYCRIIAAHIAAKNGNASLSISLPGRSEEFVSAIRDSAFRKFALA